MQNNGWISLYRNIQNHWIFENDKWFKWWVIMLFEVNHKSNKITLGYDVYEIDRGYSANSLRTWGKLFDTTPKTVLKFFKLLEKDAMINRKTIGKGKQSTTLINITHYSDYQDKEETQGKRKVNAKETQRKRKVPTNNNVNNANKGNNVNKDDDVYKTITTNLERYIANKTLVKAVIENNDFSGEAHLKKRLEEFNKHLSSVDQNLKTWKDYTSHFLNWHKKNKNGKAVSKKSPTDVTL